MFNALFTKTDEYARLAQALGGPGACALFGIPGSGRAMVYAALAKARSRLRSYGNHSFFLLLLSLQKHVVPFMLSSCFDDPVLCFSL